MKLIHLVAILLLLHLFLISSLLLLLQRRRREREKMSFAHNVFPLRPENAYYDAHQIGMFRKYFYRDVLLSSHTR